MIHASDLAYDVGDFSLRASLHVERGEYFVILGPPGSGKSVIIECIVGLRRPQQGRVEIDGRDVTAAEPRGRGVGYVPQDYALFATTTVARNISFGPRVRGWPREKTEHRVREVAEFLGIGHLLGRRIPGLSGGERQRVSLARALALRPEVLILDEPVSALDEATRETLCAELRRVQRELGVTTIHVSHNLEEAFSVADRGGIMREGRFEQVGPMQDLLRRPENEFVARFMRCGNLLSGRSLGPAPGEGAGAGAGHTRVEVDGIEFPVPGERSGQVSFVIRPENLHLARPGNATSKGPGTTISVKLARTVDRCAYVRAELSGAVSLVAHMPHRAFVELGASPGAELALTVHPQDVHVLPG